MHSVCIGQGLVVVVNIQANTRSAVNYSDYYRYRDMFPYYHENVQISLSPSHSNYVACMGMRRE